MQYAPFSESVLQLLSTESPLIAMAAELDFQDDPAYLHTGTGEIIVDGKTYYGVGQFGTIDAAQESFSDQSSKTINLTISGLDSQMIRSTMVEKCRGRFGRLLIVVFDKDGNYASDILFSGRMDAAKYEYGGNQGDNKITVPLVDRMAEWNRTGTERWTDESHRARHDGDRFFYAVAQMADWPLYWGQKQDAQPFNYSN
ncbi:hypothetical protein LMG33818_000875 [Halomonadaceae bacterium LMG 33818]|uniref:hypothetical protein n=1 Tax=Cernens ardua TaxID=3402176 RepID=UPI003EDBB592